MSSSSNIGHRLLNFCLHVNNNISGNLEAEKSWRNLSVVSSMNSCCLSLAQFGCEVFVRLCTRTLKIPYNISYIYVHVRISLMISITVLKLYYLQACNIQMKRTFLQRDCSQLNRFRGDFTFEIWG